MEELLKQAAPFYAVPDLTLAFDRQGSAVGKEVIAFELSLFVWFLVANSTHELIQSVPSTGQRRDGFNRDSLGSTQSRCSRLPDA
jgi:hypothetical protein